jgi:hypothetical protein
MEHHHIGRLARMLLLMQPMVKLAAATVALLLACCATKGGGLAEPLPPGSVGYMQACPVEQPDACATGVCFQFTKQGPLCTHACKVATDCEAPSPGCNGKGVCKGPEGNGGGGGGTGTGGT